MNKIVEELRISTGQDSPADLAGLCQAGANEIERLQLQLEDTVADFRQLADRIKALDPDRLGTANQAMTFSHGFSAGIAEAETLARKLVNEILEP